MCLENTQKLSRGRYLIQLRLAIKNRYMKISCQSKTQFPFSALKDMLPQSSAVKYSIQSERKGFSDF